MVNIGANLRVVAEVSVLVQRVLSGELDRHQLRRELEQVSQFQSGYGRWTVALMVGAACAAFSALFGGDAIIFGITFLAATLAMLLRQELQKRHLNPFLTVVLTAFLATGIACLAPLLHIGNQPRLALISAVLLLVPGIPLINSVQDLLKGHIVIGIARGVTGGVVAACIALGLLLAIRLLQVNGL